MTDDTQPPKKRAPRRRTRKPATAKAPAAQSRAPTSTGDNAAQAPQSAPPSTAPRVLASVPIHVRWHDLDAFNHVNNASFLTLLEEARLQWLRRVPGEWFSEHALPVAASIQVSYRKPLTWPADNVEVELICERLGNTSMTLGNRVVQHGVERCVYAEGNLVMVWMDPATGKAVPLPEAIRKACAG
ncbi:MAG TPA: thioesterase family protein [Rhodanobacteraceae bacterium]